MGFHEVQFPTGISYGSKGGPTHRTDIVVLDSGAEERISRWDEARRQYNVAYGVKSLNQLTELQTFCISRRGSAFGFRYKDWLDFTTSSNHRSSPTNIDQVIGTGDDAEVDFQLLKRYTSGLIQRVRNIRKPVTGTTVVAFDGVNQASGWTVNTVTGIITFTSPPGVDVVITAGCQFDVPVRFGGEVDSYLQLTIEDFDQGNTDISVVEIIDDDQVSDEYYYGGSSTHDPMIGDVTVTEGNGRVQVFNPTASGLKVKLVDPADFPPGGPYFYLVNVSATITLAVTQQPGGASIGTLAVSSMAEVVLDDSGNWILR